RRASSEHPVVSRSAAQSRTARRSRTAMGASVATHHFRSARRNPRYPSSDIELALFRGATAGGAPPHQVFLARPGAEIPGLFRAGAESQWRQVYRRAAAELHRSVLIPDHRGAALRLPKAYEAVREENSWPRWPA